MSNRNFLTISAALGAIAVILGAFGAHGLKNLLSPYQLEIWNKGVFYQFIHVLALLFCGIINHLKPLKHFSYAMIAFLIGIICFSGSLYLLAIRDFIAFPATILGPITPIGGLFFVGGWIVMALGIRKI